MFIGGHRSLDWGGVEPEAEFLLNPSMIVLPCCTSPVRALLGGQGLETLGAALPHLGPNTHCSIVPASVDKAGGVKKGGDTVYVGSC